MEWERRARYMGEDGERGGGKLKVIWFATRNIFNEFSSDSQSVTQ